MHSSRMHTVHCSGRLEGVCLGGVCLGGVCLGRCVCLPRRVYTSPSPVNRMTDRCKNITFPQLCLRTVTKNPHLPVISQTFVMGGVNLREFGVISVAVMNFPYQFETNICIKTILPASTVKR